MVGEPLEFDGGKSIESDILSKRLEFFRNLSEHVLIIGNRVVSAACVQAGTTATIYTVPSNKFFFIYSVMMSDTNSNVGNKRLNFRVKGESSIVAMVSVSGSTQNKIFTFPTPIVLKAGEILELNKNDSNTNHEGCAYVTGYEVDQEVLYQQN